MTNRDFIVDPVSEIGTVPLQVPVTTSIFKIHIALNFWIALQCLLWEFVFWIQLLVLLPNDGRSLLIILGLLVPDFSTCSSSASPFLIQSRTYILKSRTFLSLYRGLDNSLHYKAYWWPVMKLLSPPLALQKKYRCPLWNGLQIYHSFVLFPTIVLRISYMSAHCP